MTKEDKYVGRSRTRREDGEVALSVFVGSHFNIPFELMRTGENGASEVCCSGGIMSKVRAA